MFPVREILKSWNEFQCLVLWLVESRSTNFCMTFLMPGCKHFAGLILVYILKFTWSKCISHKYKYAYIIPHNKHMVHTTHLCEGRTEYHTRISVRVYLICEWISVLGWGGELQQWWLTKPGFEVGRWGDVDWCKDELVIRHQSWVKNPHITNIRRLIRDDEIE